MSGWEVYDDESNNVVGHYNRPEDAFREWARAQSSGLRLIEIPGPASVEGSRRIDKLDTHSLRAQPAVDALVEWLRQEPELVIAAARGRHAEGSVRFGDTLMYEYDDATLRAEALQELADAVNYFVVLLSREKQP